MTALRLHVYRDNIGDCTNGGISSKYNELLVICDDGYIDIDENNPPENAVKLVKRKLFGKTLFHLEPIAAPKGVGWMFGGNYAATSDGRFSEMLGGMYGAVAIHDRQESQKEYDILSH